MSPVNYDRKPDEKIFEKQSSKRKIIFFDIDGTLVSHAGKIHIPASAPEAVKRLRENGHVTAIATARNSILTRKTAVFFGIDLRVCGNGAHVFQETEEGERCLYETWLSAPFVRALREEGPALSEKFYALDAENIYTDWKADFLTDYIIEQAGFDCRRPVAALAGKKIHLAAAYFPTPPKWLEYDGVDAIMIKEREGRSGSAEFRPQGVSKWSGILKAAASLGFDVKDVVTVGDGLNDVEMVRNAGLGIAVGGACPELKAVAGLVSGDIDEDGIFSVFRRLGMI